MCYPKGFFASQGDIGTMPVLHKVIKKKSSPVFKFLAACALAQFILSSPVFAANVVLKNGDRLTGEIIKLSDNILTFKSPLFGEVELPWKQVVELQSDDGVTVKLKDGSIAKGRVTLSSQGDLVIDQDDFGRSKPLQKTDIAMFNPPVMDRSVKYSGRANFGGVFNRGNSEDDALNFDTELIARTPESRYTVAAEVNEAESAGETTTSNRYLLTQYDAFLSEKDYLFVSAKGEQDKLADLNLRTSLGAGYGYQFFETELAKMSTEYGLVYVNEDYLVAPDESFPSVSFALNYERKFWNKRLVFFNNNNLSVSLEDMADSLLKTKVGLRVPIVENVNVATQVNVDYNNMPPPGVKKTDSSLIFSVGYGF
jgi:putative salt-induced outer membrane protein YdiY